MLDRGTMIPRRLLIAGRVVFDARLNARLIHLENSDGDSVFAKNRLFARLIHLENSDAESSTSCTTSLPTFSSKKLEEKLENT